MKNIKEKQFLVNMAKALGQKPDPALVKEIEEYNNLMESVKSSDSGITDFFNQLSQLKDEVESIKTTVEVKQQYFKETDFPKPPTLDELLNQLEQEKEDELVQSYSPEEPTPTEKTEPRTQPTLAERAAEHITKEVKLEEKAESYQQPDAPLLKSLDDVRKKIKFLEDWISKISLLGPGSGEVNLLKLDDVDTRNLGDNKAIFYNAANAKLEFRTVSGGGGGGAVDSVNGQTGAVTLTTTEISEGSNLYFTNARVYSAVTGNLSLKANITDLTSSNITEGSNQYFTNARAVAALTAGTNITIESNGRISSSASGGASNLLSVSSAIIPDTDSVHNLGSVDKRWGTLYLANNTIDLGGALISSDGTGTITISSLGAVLPVNSKINTGTEEKPIALLGSTGAVTTLVPFYTKTLGLNTIATNFNFGANPDDYVFTNFTFNNGTSITQSSRAQFYF